MFTRSARKDQTPLLLYTNAVVAKQMWGTVSFMDFGFLSGGRILPSVFMCQSQCPVITDWLLSGRGTRVIIEVPSKTHSDPVPLLPSSLSSLAVDLK
jgi:hypothetical protein